MGVSFLHTDSRQMISRYLIMCSTWVVIVNHNTTFCFGFNGILKLLTLT